MTWDEFSDLVGGLNEQTPLVRVAQIRLEKDPKRVREMTTEQRRMRAEWQRRGAKRRTEGEVASFLADMAKAMGNMFGGDDD